MANPLSILPILLLASLLVDDLVESGAVDFSMEKSRVADCCANDMRIPAKCRQMCDIDQMLALREQTDINVWWVSMTENHPGGFQSKNA